MNPSPARLPRAILIALICVTCITAPRCRRATPAPAPQNSVLGVETFSPKAAVGTGVTWSYGSMPTAPFAGPLLTNHINPHRAASGLPLLKWHDGFAAISQIHANDMVANNYFGATTAGGIDPAEDSAASSLAINFTTISVAYGKTPGNSLQIFNDLMKIPSTRAMIEDPSADHFGGYYTLNPNGRGMIIFGTGVSP